MNFLNLIATFFQRENGEVSSNDDSTRYRIVTGTSEYLGTIIHQDGVVTVSYTHLTLPANREV